MQSYRNGRKKAGRTLLIVLTVLSAAMITVSLMGNFAPSPVRNAVGIVITPLQRGLNSFGVWVSGLSSNLTDSAALREENAALQEKVDTLSAENSKLVLDKEELARLQSLLQLKEDYSDYDSVGARVISRDSGNWFNKFTIDKGTDDGIQAGCNVIAGSGLVGIVTEAGKNWARVRSIIDDDSNVSAMISTTSDTCIIAGNLQLIDSGTLSLVKLTDDNNHVHVGDKVVTSNISEKFLPGILIGYISELNNDANLLTKSGSVTPAVDFKHLQEVLVIRTLKEYVPSEGDVPENESDGSASASASSQGNVLTAPRADQSGSDHAADQNSAGAVVSGNEAENSADAAAGDAASQGSNEAAAQENGAAAAEGAGE